MSTVPTAVPGYRAAWRDRIRNDFLISDSGLPDQVPPAAAARVGFADDVWSIPGQPYCDPKTLDLGGRVWRTRWQRCSTRRAHARISFGYHHAAAPHGVGSHDERFGVCRDFAHLAYAVPLHEYPARYCTAIRRYRRPSIRPRWISAPGSRFISTALFTFDARHNHPRIGPDRDGAGPTPPFAIPPFTATGRDYLITEAVGRRRADIQRRLSIGFPLDRSPAGL